MLADRLVERGAAPVISSMAKAVAAVKLADHLVELAAAPSPKATQRPATPSPERRCSPAALLSPPRRRFSDSAASRH